MLFQMRQSKFFFKDLTNLQIYLGPLPLGKVPLILIREFVGPSSSAFSGKKFLGIRKLKLYVQIQCQLGVLMMLIRNSICQYVRKNAVLNKNICHFLGSWVEWLNSDLIPRYYRIFTPYHKVSFDAKFYVEFEFLVEKNFRSRIFEIFKF